MKKFLLAGLLFLSSLAVGSEPIKLSFNPEKGAKYEYRIEMTQNVKQNIMGQDVPMETKMNTMFLMEIVDKTAQEIQMQVAYQELEYLLSSKVMKIKYNSKSKVKNPTKMEEMFDKMFSALIGKPFRAAVSPDGSVTSVIGVDAISENMLRAVADDGPQAAQAGAAMKQQFSDAAVKDMFEKSLKIYPSYEIKTGDSWNSEIAGAMNNMNTSVKTKYTLKEVKGNRATIAVESDIKMDPDESMEGRLAGTQTGTQIIDTKTGMLISGNVSQNVKGSLEAQGVSSQMELITKVKTSIKEVKR